VKPIEKEAESVPGAAGARVLPDLDGDPARRLKKQSLAAFDKIRAGLSDHLRVRSEPAGGRSRHGRKPGGPADPGLTSEVTRLLLRLLFLLFADGRGLYSAACRLRAFHAESDPGLGGLGIPEVNRVEVLRLLGCGRERGRVARGDADFAEMDVSILGEVYEAILAHVARRRACPGRRPSGKPASLRKSTGRYYTPRDVVDYILRGALGRKLKGLSSSEILGIKVLDPAVGSGLFLIRAVDRLAGAYCRALAREAGPRGRAGTGGIADHRNLVIRKCVYGVDTDPVAVEVARLSLWLLAGGGSKTLEALNRHLRCGDSLLGTGFDNRVPWPGAGRGRGAGGRSDGSVRDGPPPFHWGLEFPGASSGQGHGPSRGFDVIVGNPPYLSFSGRQKTGGEICSPGYGRDRSRTKGWPSTHGFFILRAVDLLKDDGILSFITPGQVGDLRGYGPVRAGLLEVCDLLEVRYWGEAIFKGVTTPALTFVAKKRGTGRTYGCVLKRQDGGLERLRPKGEAPWFVSPRQGILDRMSEEHPALETFWDRGVHTGNVSARLLLRSPKPGSVPVIEGRQVHPFRCEPPARWLDLRYKPSEGEYFRIADSDVYINTDIVIRQTASRPVAARHSLRCHFRNSVLALNAPDGYSVDYLLGILNSDAAGILYGAIAPEARQRAFPQIKVHALRRLPIPDPRLGPNRRIVARIERVVGRIEACLRDSKPTGRLIRALNMAVWDLYGVPGG
jgi:hypothetical protein